MYLYFPTIKIFMAEVYRQSNVFMTNTFHSNMSASQLYSSVFKAHINRH